VYTVDGADNVYCPSENASELMANTSTQNASEHCATASVQRDVQGLLAYRQTRDHITMFYSVSKLSSLVSGVNCMDK
jgi:hypothetical protein